MRLGSCDPAGIGYNKINIKIQKLDQIKTKD
jgi:hypothetical protein